MASPAGSISRAGVPAPLLEPASAAVRSAWLAGVLPLLRDTEPSVSEAALVFMSRLLGSYRRFVRPGAGAGADVAMRLRRYDQSWIIRCVCSPLARRRPPPFCKKWLRWVLM